MVQIATSTFKLHLYFTGDHEKIGQASVYYFTAETQGTQRLFFFFFSAERPEKKKQQASGRCNATKLLMLFICPLPCPVESRRAISLGSGAIKKYPLRVLRLERHAAHAQRRRLRRVSACAARPSASEPLNLQA